MNDVGTVEDFVSYNAAYGDYSGVVSSLDDTFSNLCKVFPEEVVSSLERSVGTFVRNSGSDVLGVVPAGSVLYGTQVPTLGVHDYDYTVFVSPFRSKNGVKVHQNGVLDVNYVDVSEMSVISRKSLPFTEALYAVKHGRGFGVPDSGYSDFLRSVNVPVYGYFDTVSRTVSSKSQQFVEPVSVGDKLGYKNFKHTVRWGLYLDRCGDSGDGYNSFDPRLSDIERLKYHSCISAGRLL